MVRVRLHAVVALACAACGIDAVGTLAAPEAPLPPPGQDGGDVVLEAGPDPADAGSEATESGVPVELGLCDDPELLACLPFEGAVVDESQAQLVPTSAAAVGFVA